MIGVQDSKVHEAYMGPIWGQQDPDGPQVGRINLANGVFQKYICNTKR